MLKDDLEDPGGLAIIKLRLLFCLYQSININKVVNFLRNVVFCLSQVFINGLQIVSKFNFIYISFAFVLLIKWRPVMGGYEEKHNI